MHSGAVLPSSDFDSLVGQLQDVLMNSWAYRDAEAIRPTVSIALSTAKSCVPVIFVGCMSTHCGHPSSQSIQDGDQRKIGLCNSPLILEQNLQIVDSFNKISDPRGGEFYVGAVRAHLLDFWSTTISQSTVIADKGQCSQMRPLSRSKPYIFWQFTFTSARIGCTRLVGRLRLGHCFC